MEVEVEFTEYRLLDGTIIGGTCDLELVEAMAEQKFRTPRSRAAYRRATAKRVKDMYGQDIDASSDEKFIQGLKDAQLLSDLD